MIYANLNCLNGKMAIYKRFITKRVKVVSSEQVAPTWPTSFGRALIRKVRETHRQTLLLSDVRTEYGPVWRTRVFKRANRLKISGKVRRILPFTSDYKLRR